MSLIRRPAITVVPFWRDLRILRVVAQLLFVVVIVLAGMWFNANLLRGLTRLGKPLSFDFLQGSASFALAESVIPYDPDQSYAYAFLAGVLNTVRVAVVGMVLASLLGLLAGIARLSTNWLIAKMAQAYVEALRNTPLLIQLSIWYFAGILRLPLVRQSIELPGPVFLSNRGLIVPWFTPGPAFTQWLQLMGGALAAASALHLLLGRLGTPSALASRRSSLTALIVLLAGAIGAGALDPFVPSPPRIQGFNYAGGLSLSPEYTALLFGLVVYTGAHIAEIVRAGIQAVPRGLNEAARALGLSYFQTLRLVIVPLALRVIIPPLTNQYLNLTKNSSLAVAIGYADLFYVGQTILNQSGQTVQVIVMVMGAYLLMSLVISFIMNQVNARFKLVER
jgi:general L-amino acid transport system permease protein